MKKGVELPGKEGRWVLEHTYIGMDPGDKLPSPCQERGDYVVLRRLPEEKPMPELRIGDAAILEGGETRIVTDVSKELFDAADIHGTRHVCRLSKVVAVRRDGSSIWKRGDPA